MDADILTNLGLAQATVATLGTVMIIGLGFLHRPSRSALLWSLAFVLAMSSTWVSITGAALESEPLRRAGLGLMLGAPALIWSGFRARRGARALPWVAAVQAVMTAGVFVGAPDPSSYGLAFRVGFFASSLFAGLTVFELRRASDRSKRMALPLTIVSGAFVGLGASIIVAGAAAPADIGDLALPRVLNSLAMLVYLVCATVSLLHFTSISPIGTRSASSWPRFVATASDRLERARKAQETSWAVLTVRLDDPVQLRGAAGENGWSGALAQFHSVVAECFPAEADLGSEMPGRVVVVVARPGAVLREHVRAVLRRVTEIDVSRYIDVQLSASVGWVPAEAASFDLPELIELADRAAADATGRGGDQWERVRR